MKYYNRCPMSDHACSSKYRKAKQKQEALGKSKNGLVVKFMLKLIYLVILCSLFVGQNNDITQAKNLPKNINDSTLIVDKEYDSDVFVESLKAKGSKIAITPKCNHKVQGQYDQYVNKEGRLIECFLVKLNILDRYF